MINHTKNQTTCLPRRILTVTSLVLSLVSGWPNIALAADASTTSSMIQTVSRLFRDVGSDNITNFVKAVTETAAPFSIPFGEDGAKTEVDDIGVVVPETQPTIKTYRVDVTGYGSTVEQCDSDPFVTADGSIVEDGIVAANFLPFGTKIRIPKYYGDRIFTVHDRMNARYWYRVDIWMPVHKDAINWGIKRNIEIEVVELGNGKTQWAGWTKTRLAEAQREAKAKMIAMLKTTK